MSVWLSTVIASNMKHYDNMPQRITVHLFFVNVTWFEPVRWPQRHFSKIILISRHTKTGYFYTAMSSRRTNLIRLQCDRQSSRQLLFLLLYCFCLLCSQCFFGNMNRKANLLHIDHILCRDYFISCFYHFFHTISFQKLKPPRTKKTNKSVDDNNTSVKQKTKINTNLS